MSQVPFILHVKSLLVELPAINTGYNIGRFQWSFLFVFLRLLFFCFVVAICDLVHDCISHFLCAFFISHFVYARETANCSFTGITHFSEFFPDVVST